MNSIGPAGISLEDVQSFLLTNQTYFEAFAEADPRRRRELLTCCMTEDAEIWGPNRLFAGHAAISEKIEAFHRNWPACRLVLASGIVRFDRFARFAVAIVRPDNSVVSKGENVDELAL